VSRRTDGPYAGKSQELPQQNKDDFHSIDSVRYQYNGLKPCMPPAGESNLVSCAVFVSDNQDENES